jgi:cytochrome o ubiquinol oxidase operon protein cyoD
MQASADRRGPTPRTYLIGFVLALVLTAIPFGLVATGALAAMATLVVIALMAIVQILVHLRYFLHLDLRSSPPENLLAIAFAAVLIFIMIGGSLWIMLDLRARMII